MKTKYMMATTAIHKLGDISRDKPDLCLIYGEDGDAYIGNWVAGYGFFDVRFPKATTRELTQEEFERYNGKHLVIGNSMVGTIRLDSPKEPAE